jgi:hypothetical protein
LGHSETEQDIKITPHGLPEKRSLAIP